MLYRIAFFFFTINCLYKANAQPLYRDSRDSIIFKKADYAFTLSSKKSDSALLLAREALGEAKDEGSNRTIANAWNALGWVMMHKGNLDSAELLLKKAVTSFYQLPNRDDIVRASINLSEIYTKQNKFKEAISVLLSADSICLLGKNKAFHNSVKRQLGIVYRETGDPEKGLMYLKQAMDGFEALGDHFRYVGSATSLGILYRTQKKYDSSLIVLLNCKKIIVEITQSPYQLAMTDENIGETYYAMADYSRALQHYQLAYALFDSMNNQADLAFESLNIGKTLAQMGNNAAAEKYLLNALTISDSLKMFNYTYDITVELASFYKRTQNWQKAYTYLQKSTILKDSIAKAEQMKAAVEMKEKFEAQKKEKEIASLRSHNELMRWWTFSGILVIGLAWVLYRLFMNNKKVKREKLLNQFATSLYNQNTVDDVLWDIARNCVLLLGFKDCVIYGYDEKKDILIQKAAFGPKNPEGRKISNLLQIPMGKGIVGHVAQSKEPELVKDVQKDSRYIKDEQEAGSEITIPILSDQKLLAVLDSEHQQKGFYKKHHLDILMDIAQLCSKKISGYFIEESLRKKISRDLHDEIGSTLSTIAISSRIALAQNDDKAAVNYQLQKIMGNTGRTMESMNDIIWSINPKNDNWESLLTHMRQFAAELCEPLNINFYLDADIDDMNGRLGPEKRQHIYLIYKEALNNAVKYSACSMIHIQLSIKNQLIQMSIKDNGKGFEKLNHREGNGLQNMEERALQLKGKININSTLQQGTRVMLQCPLN